MADKLVLPVDRELSQGYGSGSLVSLHVDLSLGCLDFLTAQLAGFQETGSGSCQSLKAWLGNLYNNTSLYLFIKAHTASGGLLPTFSSLTHKPQASRLDMVTNAVPLFPLRGRSMLLSLESGRTHSLPAPSLCSLHFPCWPPSL